MAITNLSGLYNNSKVWGIAKYVADTSDGLFFGVWIIAIFFIVTFATSRNYDIDKSILLASFVCFGLSLGLTAIELLQWYYMASFAVIMIIDGYWIKMSDNAA